MRYLSLFSGMEAAHLAWHPLGWQCTAVAEVDPRACELLAARLPHVPNLGDVTKITAADIARLGRIDVVIGGSPCQDLSVAGKRRGLAGARSGLFHEQVRIFHAAQQHCGARWLVWENVPGAFSSHGGRDFACVVGTMAGCRVDVPADGWGNEGVALGDDGLVEWAVLDAQWFGVAQRRRRVFAVLDTGNWADRPPVLLERESLRGDSAPRRETGEGVAGTLTSSAGGSDENDARDGRLTVAHSLRAEGFDASEDGTGRGTPIIPAWPADVACTLDASYGDKQGLGNQHVNGGGRSLWPPIAMCLNAGAMGRQDAESETLIPTFGGGFDADPIAFDTTQITSPANGSNPQPGDPCHTLAAGAAAPAIAFDCKASGRNGFGVGAISPTLRAMGAANGRSNGGGQVAVAITLRGREGGAAIELGDDCGHALRASQGGGDKAHVFTETGVRRLTPRECERLQGATDDWTLVPGSNGKPMKDGPRYKILGNSFAVPVIRWIGVQIERAQQASIKQEAA